MSESKTPRTDVLSKKCGSYEEFIAEFEKLELELNEARAELNKSWIRAGDLTEDIEKLEDKKCGAEQKCDELRSQLTTAQQDLAKIANALRTQQQRYHDLSEEVEGLKRVIVKVDDLLRRIEETRWGHDGCCGVTFLANEARQTIDDCSAMKGTKE